MHGNPHGTLRRFQTWAADCVPAPIDAMSVSRISHPKDRFYTVRKNKSGVKPPATATGDFPTRNCWDLEENAPKFLQAATGIVRSIEKYGISLAFPNLAGLAEYRKALRRLVGLH